jgi:hypothetical protein
MPEQLVTTGICLSTPEPGQRRAPGHRAGSLSTVGQQLRDAADTCSADIPWPARQVLDRMRHGFGDLTGETASLRPS